MKIISGQSKDVFEAALADDDDVSGRLCRVSFAWTLIVVTKS